MPDRIIPAIHFPGVVGSPVDGFLVSFPVWLSGVLVGDRVGETDAFFPPNTKALEREPHRCRAQPNDTTEQRSSGARTGCFMLRYYCMETKRTLSSFWLLRVLLIFDLFYNSITSVPSMIPFSLNASTLTYTVSPSTSAPMFCSAVKVMQL